jgi:hypothetical protein
MTWDWTESTLCTVQHSFKLLCPSCFDLIPSLDLFPQQSSSVTHSVRSFWKLYRLTVCHSFLFTKRWSVSFDLHVSEMKWSKILRWRSQKDYVTTVLQKPQEHDNRLPPPRTLIIHFTMTHVRFGWSHLLPPGQLTHTRSSEVILIHMVLFVNGGHFRPSVWWLHSFVFLVFSPWDICSH